MNLRTKTAQTHGRACRLIYTLCTDIFDSQFSWYWYVLYVPWTKQTNKQRKKFHDSYHTHKPFTLLCLINKILLCPWRIRDMNEIKNVITHLVCLASFGWNKLSIEAMCVCVCLLKKRDREWLCDCCHGN